MKILTERNEEWLYYYHKNYTSEQRKLPKRERDTT